MFEVFFSEWRERERERELVTVWRTSSMLRMLDGSLLIHGGFHKFSDYLIFNQYLVVGK